MRIALACLLTTGCLTTASERDGGGGRPTLPTPPVPTSVARGAYQIASTIDITIEQLVPEPAANLVATLRDFETAPAHTLITLAADAGVPAVGTLRSALPDALESKLEGWIDAEIATMKLDGVPVTQLAGNLVTYAEAALTQARVESTLVLDDGTATHTLAVLDLAPAGLEARFDLGTFPNEIISATASASSTNNTLALGGHGFAIAYGEYAWRAIEAKHTAEYGAGIRQTLGAAVNCPVIAQRVASKCALGVCVGHATELTSICERGLDEVVSRAHAKLASFRFDAMRFEAGTAKLVDTNADGVSDQLTDGVWTAKINAGQGLRPAPATFTATR